MNTRQTDQAPRRIRGMFAWVALLATTAGGGACATETLEPDVMKVGLSDGSPTAAGATIILHMSRDDDSPPRADAPFHRLRIDGRFAAWNESDFVTFSTGSVMLTIPPGAHSFEVVGPDGQALVTTGALESDGGVSHFLAVFGPPEGLQHRWFANDPSAVPAGASHIRLLNALKSRDTIQPLLCPNGDRNACAPTGPPIAHGETFQIDHPAQAVAELKWRPSTAPLPDVFDMTRLYPFQAPCTPGTLMMPIYLGGTGGAWLSIEGSSYLCEGP